LDDEDLLDFEDLDDEQLEESLGDLLECDFGGDEIIFDKSIG